MKPATKIQTAITKLARHEQFELANCLAKSLGLRLYTDDGFDWENTRRKLSEVDPSKTQPWTDEDWQRLHDSVK